MADAITIKALQDASLDAKSLEEVVNGDDTKQVTTRLGETYPSVKKAIKTLFENGGLPATPFNTKSELESSELLDGDYGIVINEGVDSGLYVKQGGVWDRTGFFSSKVVQAVREFSESILRTSLNLYNKKADQKGIVIGSDGSVTQNISYYTSEFIEVDPDALYAIHAYDGNPGRAFSFIAFYDSARNFIKRDNTDTYTEVAGGFEVREFTTPSNAYFVRLMTNQDPEAYPSMLTKGSDLIPYSDYGVTLKGINPSDEYKDQIIEILKKEAVAGILTKSKNLYNPDEARQDYALKADGSIEPTTGYSVSDYIVVTPNEKYTLSSDSTLKADASPFIHIGYYDANKNFLSRVQAVVGNSTITIPASAEYVRLNTNAGSNFNHKRMFSKGSVASKYEPYGLFLPNERLAIVQPPKNLYNYRTAIKGKLVDSQGAITERLDYSLSDFIKVEPNGTYTYSGNDENKSAFIYTATYDANKNFIARISTATHGTGTSTKTVTFGADVHYIRLNINQGEPDELERIIVVGSQVLDYDSGIPTLVGVELSDEMHSNIEDKIDDKLSGISAQISSKTKFAPAMSFDGTFSTNKVWTGYENFKGTTQSTDIYSWFDTLKASHPTYITTQELGNDEWGNRIAAYHFKPETPNLTIGSKRKPKIYLICGTHGYEQMPPLATYLMIEQVCNNWQSDKLLEAMRFEVEFIIIPVSNPSGWNAVTRKNGNGVDIARSFPEGFGWQSTDPDSSQYGGEVPLQELESQYIQQIFDENPDVDACYDFHHFGGAAGRDWNIWLATANPEVTQPLLESLSTKLTRKWRSEYSWLPKSPTWFTGYSSDLHGAMIQDHALARGIQYVGTFEVGEKWWLNESLTVYDPIHCKTAVESITNWILINCNEITRQ